MTPKMTTSVVYAEHYKTQCKHAWYGAGRPDKLFQADKMFPEDEYGRRPDTSTINTWRNEYLWDAWADEMDAQVEKLAEDDLINSRLVMLKKQAAYGAELQLKGIEHLRKSGFDSSASAVSAMKLGIDVERTSRGISERLIKITKLSDEQLMAETQKLLDDAMETGEIIDVADIETEEDSTDGEDL